MCLKMWRRHAIPNLPSLLLFFLVVPILCLASLLLPSRCFIATMSFLCLHSRAPFWQGFANLCAVLIAGPFENVKVVGSKIENMQTVIVASPAAWTPLQNTFSYELILWALIRKHVRFMLFNTRCLTRNARQSMHHTPCSTIAA